MGRRYWSDRQVCTSRDSMFELKVENEGRRFVNGGRLKR